MTSRYDSSYEVSEIYPKIVVFKNALKQPKELIDYYEETGPWTKWLRFGVYITGQGPSASWDHFPTEDEWTRAMVGSQVEDYKKLVAKIFYEVSDIYRDKFNYEKDSWICRNWTIAKYEPTPDDPVAMNYHTDFQEEYAESPGPQFGITCVVYPNDDYVGGEITFNITKEDGSESDIVDYKPSAGDILMFPSTAPYYHGVKGISSGYKYILRLYWVHDYAGSSDWHELKEQYGSDWEELEEQRVKTNYKTQYFKSIPGAPKRTLKEYYEKLKDGTLDEWSN
jgi:2OG-Fe(II) oxygenase superfamily